MGETPEAFQDLHETLRSGTIDGRYGELICGICWGVGGEEGGAGRGEAGSFNNEEILSVGNFLRSLPAYGNYTDGVARADLNSPPSSGARL